jgi:hypothetical protein
VQDVIRRSTWREIRHNSIQGKNVRCFFSSQYSTSSNLGQQKDIGFSLYLSFLYIRETTISHFTMISVTGKAKSIDRYVAESPKRPVGARVVDGATTTAALSSIECWPEPSDDKNTTIATTSTPQTEENLYGYEDAAPTPRNPTVSSTTTSTTGVVGSTTRTTTPRRSSLKGSDKSDYNNKIDGQKPPRRASIGYTGEILTLILPTGETKEKRSSISFAEKADVRMVEPVASMVENPRTLWFQAAEYQHILEKVQDVVEHAKAQSGNAKRRRHHRRGIALVVWKMSLPIDSLKNEPKQQPQSWTRIGCKSVTKSTTMNTYVACTASIRQILSIAPKKWPRKTGRRWRSICEKERN